MSRLCLVAALLAPIFASASWYWPFGSDDDGVGTRVSDLIRPATRLINNAADYAEEGKVDEAVEEYRKALDELDRIEVENPERVSTPEFATLRNKRAYVNSAIDSLLLEQARRNATAVAITDTTELEKLYAKHLEAKRNAMNPRPLNDADDDVAMVAEAGKKPKDDVDAMAESMASEGIAVGSDASQARREHRRKRLQVALKAADSGDVATAKAVIEGILAEKPNDAAALNLKARIEMESKDMEAAEKTLDQCIRSNPHSYHAYYNMARLMLRTREGEKGRESAAKYYRMGRKAGGRKDEALEVLCM